MKRRWFDFRMGHSTYLIFALSFANFILIFHRLLIERLTFLEDSILQQLWFFVIIFIVAYIPISLLIGSWHRKTQFKVESEVLLRQNPFLVGILRTIIDIQIGKAKQEEIDAMRKLLKSIEKGNKFTS